MGRIIINFDDSISVTKAMNYVNSVIKMGRCSGLNEECYCYATKFVDNTVVLADVTKTGTDVFKIIKENE